MTSSNQYPKPSHDFEHHMIMARNKAYNSMFDYAEEMKKDGFYTPDDIAKEINRIAASVRCQFVSKKE